MNKNILPPNFKSWFELYKEIKKQDYKIKSDAKRIKFEIYKTIAESDFYEFDINVVIKKALEEIINKNYFNSIEFDRL